MLRLLFIFLLSSCCFASHAQTFGFSLLKCDDRESPAGVDPDGLSFGWEIRAASKGFFQNAYQLILATDSASLEKPEACFWNSGRMNSSNSISVKYLGGPLAAGTRYFWKVKIWDERGRASAWSKTASFITALSNRNDWSAAQWIGYEEMPGSLRVVPGIHLFDTAGLGNKLLENPVVPLFRKTFRVEKKIKNALVFVSGLGQYELSINGKKAGDQFLIPGWTDYDKRVLYNVFDITRLLQPGKNAVGMIVGNGFYHINRERYYKLAVAFGWPKMICKIRINFTDGSDTVVVSDASWKASASPIRFTSIYGGEDYDAGSEQPGWDRPSFRDDDWRSAVTVAAPGGFLEAEPDYPVKTMETFTVKKIIQPRPGIYVYDFGQNASGIVEIKLTGKKGQSVRLTPAELLTPENLANQQASGKPYYYTYTLKGNGVETWRPRFTYYGFRYVQVEGAVPAGYADHSGKPEIRKLSFLHTYSSAPRAGAFTCSDSLFNRINRLILQAMESNLQSVVTDCPHREKLSWLEQDHLMGESIHYNFDIHALYKKLVFDMMDAQTENGLIPDIAPEYVEFAGGFRDSPEWGSSSVILPWYLYKWYGDTAILRKAYPMMKKYTSYLESRSKNHLLSYGLGDWFDFGPAAPGEAQLTPKALTATAIYFYDLSLLSQMAKLLHDEPEAKRLNANAAAVKKAFNDKFFDPQTKIYSTGSQTAIAMPYVVGLVDPSEKKAVFQTLLNSIEHSGKALTAGDVGFHYLIEALSEGGASDMIYAMNNRDDVPGYGFQLKKGATALTESWPALKEVSNNHLMLGHIMEWFYNGLGGIRQSPASVAYNQIEIRPVLLKGIPSGSAVFHSPYGMIETSWKRAGEQWDFTIDIPANSSADLYLPGSEVIEKGRTSGKEARKINESDGRIHFKTGSGHYRFILK